MNAPPVPKPRVATPSKIAQDLPKKPIPLPRVRNRQPTYDNQNASQPLYNNTNLSSSSASSSVEDDSVVNILDATDEHYYATILEKPDPPLASPSEKRGRNGFDRSRELIKTFSSDLQEKGKT
ncbi:uncharacterized protein LOC113363737 [Ctenocephalides felis]|uniref:uncharacterized protein LOC113363737 n=1 Tax=Ctenocephalides felis TaxID=7515 RepID=UPI000E6E164E|nr:uncharacterized protein LOC113363737 [Ctenocephalides felis]